MGQIKKQKKKYDTPSYPWQAERILEEGKYTKEFGFKNKKEIWKVIAKLKNYKFQVKNYIADKNSGQMKKEKDLLMNKLLKYGLIKKDSKVEDVLDLEPRDLMERRLNTLIFKSRLARSLKQARQFIVHGHISVNGKKITVPSYLVSLEEESKLRISPKLPIMKEEEKKEQKKEAPVAGDLVKKETELVKKEDVPVAADLVKEDKIKDKEISGEVAKWWEIEIKS